MKGGVLTFYLEGNLYGIALKTIQEINRCEAYTEIPMAPDFVDGLMNLRGNIITLINLAKILGYGRYKSADRKCIVLKSGYGLYDQIAFKVDKLGEVVDLDSDMHHHPAANISETLNGVVNEVMMLNGKLLLLIEIERLYGYLQINR